MVGGDCVLSGEEIIEKTWTDPRTEDGCLVGCAAPFVVVLVATGAWAATIGKEWWTWVALLAAQGSRALASEVTQAHFFAKGRGVWRLNDSKGSG